MTGRLEGIRVVVTGALGGIGTAACAALRREGARVVGLDLTEAHGVLAADVTDEASVRAAIERAALELGGIDVLVNNAGIGVAGDTGLAPGAADRAVLDVNLMGTWIPTAAALPHLLASRGHVVNVSSGLALINLPYSAAYTASKRAVAGLSDVLRMEYAGRLTVTTVFPGYVRTAIHEGPARQGVSLEGVVPADRVERAAAAIVRACVRRPRQVATGALTAFGLWGARHFPRLTDAVVARLYRRALREGRITQPIPADELPR